jgi:hypothetical protein
MSNPTRATAPVHPDQTAAGEIELDPATRLVHWLETGVRRPGLFAEDVAADLSLPCWRIQTRGADAAYRLREENHPFRGEVRVEALDSTARGFLLQFEERWASGGQRWYCRELIHGVVRDGLITELVVYCTGDWDEDTQARHRMANPEPEVDRLPTDAAQR